MLNKPKYILFILTIAFSALTLANVVLFYLHIEDQTLFITSTIATCTFSTFSLLYLFNHFKKNYISKKVIEDDNGEIDIKKLKLEIEKAQKEKRFVQRKNDFEKNFTTKLNTEDFGSFITKQLVKDLDACQAAYFKLENESVKPHLKLSSSYAYHIPASQEVVYELGEGLSGQAALEGKIMNVKKIPDGYVSIMSGLGKASPSHMLIIPFKHNGNVNGVLELASFHEFNDEDEKFLEHISELA